MKVLSICFAEVVGLGACVDGIDGGGYGMFGPLLSAIHMNIPGCKKGYRKVRIEGSKGLLATLTRGLLMDVAAKVRELGIEGRPYCVEDSFLIQALLVTDRCGVDRGSCNCNTALVFSSLRSLG